jgi:Tol biopolymer transport system component
MKTRQAIEQMMAVIIINTTMSHRRADGSARTSKGALDGVSRLRCRPARWLLAPVLLIVPLVALTWNSQRAKAQAWSCGISQVTSSTGAGNSTPSISADGSSIAFASTLDLTPGSPGNADGSSEIFLYNRTTSTLSQITNTVGRVSRDPSISADGKRIAFVSTMDVGSTPSLLLKVFLYDTTTNSFSFIALAIGSTRPTISADGQRVAYLAAHSPEPGIVDVQVFLYEQVAGISIRVTTGRGNDFEIGTPSVASNGDITFESSRDLTGSNGDRNFEIFGYNRSSGNITQITNTLGGSNASPSISGNGEKIAFTSDRNLTGGNPNSFQQVFIYNTQTGVFTQATASGGILLSPSISANGTWISFTHNDNLTGDNPDHNREIFLYNTLTGSVTQVTQTTGDVNDIFLNTKSSAGDTGAVAFLSRNDLTLGNPDGNDEIFVAACVPPTPTPTPNTPVGFNVSVSPAPNVTVTFSEVTVAGDTVATPIAGPPPPNGFQVDGIVYDISTTATYVAPITICLPYNPANSLPSIWHYQGVPPTWVDVTDSINVGSSVCGVVSSLSPFAVMEPVSTPPDTDGDGVPDDTDNCPGVSNPDQADFDGDSLGDACDSDDDNDGVVDTSDNCPLVANSNQANNDGDALGDACDPDDDNDGDPDSTDCSPFNPAIHQAATEVCDGLDNNCNGLVDEGFSNTDGDVLADCVDADDDNDGVLDGVDNCPLVANPTQTDTDKDGIGDVCDPTPNGNTRIVFSSNRDGNFEIYSMNVDGSAQTRLTNHSAIDFFPARSPDGAKIAFTSNRAGNFEVYVMNADGSFPVRLTTNARVDGAAAWSPDGSKLAFTSNRDGNFEIYSMNIDGTGLRRLTNNSAVDIKPTWSRDGTMVAFASSRPGNFEIYVVNSDGSGLRRMTNNSATDLAADWSPDGTKIVFASNRNGNFEIYSMNADGSAQMRLTNNPAVEAEPAWILSGTKIIFSSWRDGNLEIFAMNADGSGQTRLTNNPAVDTSPD